MMVVIGVRIGSAVMSVLCGCNCGHNISPKVALVRQRVKEGSCALGAPLIWI
jgi:hypothetical protein